MNPQTPEEIQNILKENHDSKLSGHYGFNKTYAKVKEQYFWPSMKPDIRKYIQSCHSCQMNKTNFKPIKQPMEITTTAEKPFEKLAIDIVGPLPLTGPDFMSELIKDLGNLLKTKHICTSPYHPQTNGGLERYHLTLKDYLKHYIKANQTDWDEYIPFATFSYNTSTHRSTNLTPYELLFGRKAYLPSSILKEPEFHYTYDDYIRSLQNRLNTSFKTARENLINSKNKITIFQYTTDTSGIFYRKLGEAKISNTELHLITYANLTYLSQAKALLNSHFIKSREICNLLKEVVISKQQKSYCEETLQSVQSELQNINNKEKILNGLIGHDVKQRRRRGLINGTSYVLNWLIGTPDADDARYYSDSIEALLNDNKQTQTLLKSQIQIVSSTIKNFNNSIQSLKLTEETLNNNMKIINKYMSETDNYIINLSLETTIMEQVATLLSLCIQVSDYFDKNIESINLGNHNIISPFLITPKDLCEELINYKDDFELMITPTYKNLPKIYKLMKLQSITINELVVFVIKLPLVKRTNFDLYNLIPLPIQHQNTSIFSFITPQNPYLLLSQQKSNFAVMSDLRNCVEYLEGKYVCTNVNTARTTEESTCEVLLLSPHVKQIPQDCSTKTINAEMEIWTYIGSNQWLYILQKPTTLTIICGENNNDHMEDIVLQKTSMIQLHSGCKGYTMLYSLEPTNYVNKNISHYVPRINLTEDDCCILASNYLHHKTISSLKPIRLTNIDLNDLKFNTKKLNELDELLTHHMKEPFIVTHTNWYTITLGIIGAVLILIVCGNCCRWIGCWNLLKRLCCFTRSPRTGEIVPPIIKNFVHCNFDSSNHSEHRDHSNDMVLFERRGREQGPSEQTTSTGITEERIMDQHQPRANTYNLRSKSGSRTRKSSTPL
uniref:uncharacterized protein LOC117611033 n=1 Tax=Osmia lignaria TaxID=473952 RepID=UPI001478C259|nr:uncharacterized protein LOC117611033 [Osmia lignaria]